MGESTGCIRKHFLQTQEVCQQVLSWACEIALESEEPLLFADELDWAQLIQLCGLRFDDRTADLPERLPRRMRNAQDCLRKECFVFVHLKQYLSQAELNALCREAFYRKMRILLVETPGPAIDRSTETAWIIDKDDREIYPDSLSMKESGYLCNRTDGVVRFSSPQDLGFENGVVLGVTQTCLFQQHLILPPPEAQSCAALVNVPAKSLG